MFMNLLKSLLHNIGVVDVGFGIALLGRGLDYLQGITDFRSPVASIAGVPLLALGFFLRAWATWPQRAASDFQGLVQRTERHVGLTNRQGSVAQIIHYRRDATGILRLGSRQFSGHFNSTPTRFELTNFRTAIPLYLLPAAVGLASGWGVVAIRQGSQEPNCIDR